MQLQFASNYRNQIRCNPAKMAALELLESAQHEVITESFRPDFWKDAELVKQTVLASNTLVRAMYHVALS